MIKNIIKKYGIINTKSLNIILSVILVLIIAVIFEIYTIKEYGFFCLNNKYISTSHRKNYNISEVDDTSLKNYVAKYTNTLLFFVFYMYR